MMAPANTGGRAARGGGPRGTRANGSLLCRATDEAPLLRGLAPRAPLEGGRGSTTAQPVADRISGGTGCHAISGSMA